MLTHMLAKSTPAPLLVPMANMPTLVARRAMSAALPVPTRTDPDTVKRESPVLKQVQDGAFCMIYVVFAAQLITTGRRWRAPLAFVISTT